MNQNRPHQNSRPRAAAHAIRTHIAIVIAALTLLAVMANVLMTIKLAARIDTRPVCPEPPRYLPCGALPMRLIHEDPACANKLLQVMNVTNVRILPTGSRLPPLDNETAEYFRDLCPQLAENSLPLPAVCRHLHPGIAEARPAVAQGSE